MRHPAPIAAALTLAAVACIADARTAVNRERVDCAKESSERHLRFDGEVLVEVSVASAQGLEVVERGSELTLRVVAPPLACADRAAGCPEAAAGDVAFMDNAFEITAPPRYGSFQLALDRPVRLTLRAALPTPGLSNHVVIRCLAPTPSAAPRRDWLREAAAISADWSPAPRGADPVLALAALAPLEARASDAEQRAFARHLRAQVYYFGERRVEAAKAFEQAETAWLALPDRSRALAARVGRLQSLLSTGQYDAVIDLSRFDAPLADGDEYFALRLDLERCVALRYRSRFEEAGQCFGDAAPRLEALGERAELANVLINLADVRRYLADYGAADEHLDRAEPLVEGPDAALLLGRIALLRADVMLARGDIAGALARLDDALRRFDEAHAEGWASSTRIRVASLYTQLGALDEAYLSLAEVFRRNNVADSPQRVASALVALARVELRDGRLAQARRYARSATRLYERLAMPTELDVARMLGARIALENDRADEAAEWLGAAQPQPLNAVEWGLVRARVALARQQPDAAAAALSSVVGPLSLVQGIERVELEGRLGAMRGGIAAALSELGSAHDEILGAISRVGNPLLRSLLDAQLDPLRRAAAGMLLECSDACPDDPAFVAWSFLPQRVSVAPQRSTSANTVRFDEAVAAELLGRPGPKRTIDALDGLLAAMNAGQDAGEVAESGRFTLEQLRLRLPPGTTLLAWLDAGSATLVLRASRDSASIARSAARGAIDAQTHRLVALASHPDVALRDIDDAARVLSTTLFGTTLSPPPSQLWVHAGSAIDLPPWPLLRWPGADNQLVETTVVGLVSTAAECCAPTLVLPDFVDVVAAPQIASGVASLPQLPAAAGEAKLFEGGTLRVREASASSREGVLALLRGESAWVHFAGHGTTVAQKLGYSGVWLEPAANAEPTFLSSLEVSGHPLRSALVVLDACRLDARAADRARTRLSFARALSDAGTQHVVAAQWPVSDAAAATWVPAFYSALGSTSEPDPGAALLAAQRALRNTRAFRHPYYWAGFLHRARR